MGALFLIVWKANRHLDYNYKFTDQEYDASSGLYNYDARLYDPVVGRFVTADSIVEDFFTPQTLNRYTYVRNNPLRYTDPTGHETTGEVIKRKGEAAAAAGKNVTAYAWAFAEAAWTFFGAESVSKVADKAASGRSDVGAGDYVGAALDILTLGKGSGALKTGKTLGSKVFSKITTKTTKSKGLRQKFRERLANSGGS